MMIARRILPNEWQAYRDLRLSSLRADPEAFCTTYATAAARRESEWIDQATAGATSPDSAIFFGFDALGKPAALAAAYRSKEFGRDAAELAQVWCAPEARGTGLASATVCGALEWSRAAGFLRVVAEVRVENAMSLKFYERLGFVVVRQPIAENHLKKGSLPAFVLEMTL